jgi:flagella basal body P-ring formation protein FlgA
MNRFMSSLMVGAFGVALVVPVKAATPIVDHGALDSAIQRFTGYALGAPGGAAAPIDRRLRLMPCGSDVRLSWRSLRRDTVVLECAVGAGWKLFVPVVPTNAVMGGGAVVEAGVLAVAKGDVVTIEVKGTGFSISQGGQAMEPGAVGSWIRIKTAGKGEVLTCQIMRRGLVSMPSP